MALKKDNVNRYQEVVVLPISGKGFIPGQRASLYRLRERDISVDVKDPLEMTDPVYGNAVGDAVFDAVGATDGFDAWPQALELYNLVDDTGNDLVTDDGEALLALDYNWV